MIDQKITDSSILEAKNRLEDAGVEVTLNIVKDIDLDGLVKIMFWFTASSLVQLVLLVACLIRIYAISK